MNRYFFFRAKVSPRIHTILYRSSKAITVHIISRVKYLPESPAIELGKNRFPRIIVSPDLRACSPRKTHIVFIFYIIFYTHNAITVKRKYCTDYGLFNISSWDLTACSTPPHKYTNKPERRPLLVAR